MVRSAMMGARVRRKEDPRLITGSSTYVDDLQLPGAVRAVFLRSPFAHATIKSIDTSAAKAAPGVLAVYTVDDLPELTGPMGPTASDAPGTEDELLGKSDGGEGADGSNVIESAQAKGQSGETAGEDVLPEGDIAVPPTAPLAKDKVRYFGEPVAVVVAETEALGRDAADLIEVDYEELPAVSSIEAALAKGAPQIWDEAPRNLALNYKRAKGDVEQAFSEAHTTVKQRIRSNRVIPMPMEGRAVAAQPDPMTGGLTVWISNQAPHWLRRDVASQLGYAESQVRVIAPEVGGGFGAKISVYREDAIVAALAKHFKRAVKWTETRSENLVGMTHGRAQLAEIELAATEEGKITGGRFSIWGETGAYPTGADMPPITTWMISGCYAIPAFDVKAYSVYSNQTPIGAYRGAGRPEAAYYIERAIDILAHKLGKDPAEVRRLNFIAPDAFPYSPPPMPGIFKYDTGEYEKELDKALEVSGYQQLRQQQTQARQQGKIMGIGMASYVEICGFGPWESSSIRVDPSGAVSIFTGISPHGRGQETTFAQIVHDQLGADYDRIVVHHGDTGNTPQGNGTMGSRGLAVGGAPLMVSAGKIREKAIGIAAHVLEAAKDDIRFENGQYFVEGAPDKALSFDEIAAASYAGNVPQGMDAGLVTTDFFSTTGTTFPFGTHIAVVEISPDTGQVKVVRFVSVDDCGKVISPLLVEGQVHGGLAQGIGQALYEEAVYDDNGQLLSSTLMEYALPHAENFPMFELHRTETTTPLNPLGAKGIGEAATIGSTPAVVNAVMDALAPFGIEHLDMPLTAPKVWAALQAAGAGRQQAAD